ncbi:MAG: hypothetical protein KC493_18100 [Bacteriovoracaceae bacterium]|nr:hypothetical protein [Bacteriovoracaceae bacterium]
MSLDVKSLRSNFELLKPIAPEFADKFYEYLWGDYPASKALFEDVKMEKQKTALIGSLVYIVDNLENEKSLVEYLESMGSRHNNYGTEEAHYEIVGASIIKALKFFFKRLWDEKTEANWVAAYGVISSCMIEGSKKSNHSKPDLPEVNVEAELPEVVSNNDDVEDVA